MVIPCLVGVSFVDMAAKTDTDVLAVAWIIANEICSDCVIGGRANVRNGGSVSEGTL